MSQASGRATKKQNNLRDLRLGGFSAGAMAADSRAMDRRSFTESRLSRKYKSGCAYAVGLTEPVANGRWRGLRHDSVVKAAMPPPEPISSSDDRLTSSADETGAGNERINRGGEYSHGHRKDSEAKEQRRPRQAVITDLSCGIHPLKSRGSHGLGLSLGCRTVAELGDESFMKISVRRTVQTEESTEAVVNQKFIDGEKSKQFMEALYILNSNKSLFVKLLEDPNSLLAKHIQELQESEKKGRKSDTVSELKMARKMGKDEGVLTLSPRKLKIWEKLLPRRSAEKDKSCEIVVLKPGLENKRSGGDRWSYFGSGGGSGNGIRAVRQSRLPFGSLRKISKHRMGGTHEHSVVEATKLTVVPSDECKELDRESFVQRLNREDQVKVLLNVGLTEVAAVDDSSLTETDDGLQLPRTFEVSKNVAQIHSRTSLSTDLVVNKIDELERIEIAERFLQDVCRDQTVSSSSDDSFSNSTEESETSADDRPEEEHESPDSVLDHPVASPIDAPLKPDRATSDMPPVKFGRAAEFMKSILTSSDLSWDAILPNYDSQNQLLRETGSSLHESGIDAQLLHDYASEVLGEAIQYRWCSYQQGLVVVDSDVASDVMTRVDWDLVLSRAQDSNTLERVITREVTMKKWSSWMRLGEETDEIVVELMGKIVEDVVDEIL